MSGTAQSAADALGAGPPSSVLTGTYGPGMVKSALGDIEQTQKQKEAAQAPVYARMQSDVTRDRARFEDIAKDYTPIEQTKAPPPPNEDPLAGFGSAASIFAALASSFTHTPAINAMNAMAGAITAQKQGDWKTYEAKYKEWKDNTEIAMKNHQLQAEDMKTAMDMMQSDLSTGVAMAKAVAAQSEDHIASKLLELGQYKDLADHQLASARAAASMQESALRVQELHMELDAKRQQFQAAQDLAKTQPGTPEHAAALQKVVDLATAEHPELMITAQRQTDAKNQVVTDPTNGKQYVYNPITRESTTLDGKPYTPGGMAKIATTQTTQAKPPTPEELQSLGAQAKTGEPLSQIVPGFGQAAIPLRQAARTAAIDQIMKDNNLSREDASVELANRSIEYASGKRSSTQLNLMLGATKQAVSQLDFNVQKAKEEMAKLPSGDVSPIVNAIANGAAKWSGDPAYASAFYYMYATATESARILAGGQASVAQLQEGARTEAEKWANLNLTPQSFDELGKNMIAEGENRIQNFELALSGQKLTGTGQVSRGGGGTVPVVSDKAAYDALPAGSHYRKAGDPPDSYRTKQ